MEKKMENEMETVGIFIPAGSNKCSVGVWGRAPVRESLLKGWWFLKTGTFGDPRDRKGLHAYRAPVDILRYYTP